MRWPLVAGAVAVFAGGAAAFPLLLGLSPWVFAGLPPSRRWLPPRSTTGSGGR